MPAGWVAARWLPGCAVPRQHASWLRGVDLRRLGGAGERTAVRATVAQAQGGASAPPDDTGPIRPVGQQISQ